MEINLKTLKENTSTDIKLSITESKKDGSIYGHQNICMVWENEDLGFYEIIGSKKKLDKIARYQEKKGNQYIYNNTIDRDGKLQNPTFYLFPENAGERYGDWNIWNEPKHEAVIWIPYLSTNKKDLLSLLKD